MSIAPSYVKILLGVFAAVELTSGARRLKREDVPQDLRCPSDKWAHFRAKCYLIEDSKSTLTEAKASCLDMDASLVDVETKAEHVFLTKLLDQEVNYRDMTDQLWTGGYREGIRWKWGYQLPSKNKDEVTTTETKEYIPVTIDYWLPNEPDTATHTGMLLSYKDNVWGWEDAATASHHLYICEKEKTNDGCRSPWTEYINSCYYVAKNVRKAQPEAKKFCSDMGGHLVAINSLLENSHLIKILKKQGILANWKSFWIGGERINGDGGTFAWDISKSSTFILQTRMMNSTSHKRSNYMILKKVDSDWFMSETDGLMELSFICELALQLTDVNQNKILTCPGDYTAIGNACYQVYKDKKKHRNAGAICAKDGGALFSVDTENELMLMTMVLDDTDHVGKMLWVGGIMVDGQWIWSRDYRKFLGTPNQFVAWNFYSPNNFDGGEDRIVYKKKDGEWKWNDISAIDNFGYGYKFGYICEKGAKSYEKEELNVECKKDQMGRNYVGKISKTKSGLSCQRWDKKQPNWHSFNKVEYFPDPASGGISAVDNYCRNPDKSPEGPWCFIGVVGDGRRETCNVPICEEPEILTSDCIKPGVAYIGKINTTVSGKTCQRWDKQTPHQHDINRPDMFPDPSVSDASNYCRVPAGVFINSKKVKWGMPWCITSQSSEDGSTVEACDVPICGQIQPMPKPNPATVVVFTCPEEFVLFEKQCYYVAFKDKTNRGNAHRNCQQKSAELVKIETKSVFSFITKYIDSEPQISERRQFWTGGQRVGLKWTWNGETLKVNASDLSMDTIKPVTFTDWRPGEPNNLREKAISMKYSSGFWGWNDIYTSSRIDLRYICEKPKSDLKGCVSPWKRFEDSCYYFSTTIDDRLHDKAKKACRERSSHLVAINSAAENTFIKRQVDKRKSRRSVYEEWWTGGERKGGVGGDEFIWDTTIVDKLSYSKWRVGKPSRYVIARGSDYMIIDYSAAQSDWKWSHIPRSRRLKYICKLPLVSEYLGGTNTAVCPATCNEAYHYRDSCYCPSIVSRAWIDAQKDCMRIGGRLISFRNEAEARAIADNLIRKQIWRYGRKMWIGGIPIDGRWVWSEDYAKFTVVPDQYTKWSPGEPNNFKGREKYIMLNQDSNGWGFNDDQTSAIANYICQKHAQEVKTTEVTQTTVVVTEKPEEVTQTTVSVTETTDELTETTDELTETTEVTKSIDEVAETTPTPTVSVDFILKLFGAFFG